MDIQNTVHVNSAFTYAQKKAISYRHEFITPEHLLHIFGSRSNLYQQLLKYGYCDAQNYADTKTIGYGSAVLLREVGISHGGGTKLREFVQNAS